MLFDAKNGVVQLGDTDMDYISFGAGEKTLVILPGLGDGLSTVKGTALPFAYAYRAYAKNYRVFVFSRKNRLPHGYTTRDMARDQAEAMAALGITGADLLGVSQGGMIAQYLAIDHSHLVHRLVLAVTLSRQNPTVHAVVSRWMEMAQQGDYQALLIDTAERSYSERYLARRRLLLPLLARIGKPKTFDRFLIQAAACLGHNAWPELGGILCPTLVLGGDSDKIVGPAASGETAGQIRGSECYLYPGLGHAAYEEAKDFHTRVLDFLLRSPHNLGIMN